MARKHKTIKQEIVDWGILNDPTLANMHLAHSHLDEQIKVEEELSGKERDETILEVASLKVELAAYQL